MLLVVLFLERRQTTGMHMETASKKYSETKDKRSYPSYMYMLADTKRGRRYIQKVSEYDQEIPQSHTVDQPTAP